MSLTAWTDVDWAILEQQTSRLQRRIYAASKNGEKGRVHFLQKKLVHSTSARFLSVKRVTQLNKGRKTSGVDKIGKLSPSEKYQLAKSLIIKGKASPIRRVMIPKPSSNEMRPLGIPTIRDRCLQQLVRLALEPEWEAKFEPNSYGFRPARGCHDAIQAIFIHLRGRSLYVLDANIAKCFDRISHRKLLAKLETFSMFENQISAWLKAGILDSNMISSGDAPDPNEMGTPQGGIISPLLANIALHGLETDVKDYYTNHLYKGTSRMALRDRRNQLAIIRYADDFVILHWDEKVIYNIKAYVARWLNQHADLELSESKTRITNTCQGFKFLGFHIISVARNDPGKLQSKSKMKCKIHIHSDSKKRFLSKTRHIILSNRSASSEQLIRLLNPLIVGWCNYFRYSECVKDFKQVEYALFQQIRTWVFRRRSKGLRSKSDLKNKYFPAGTEVKFQGRNHKGEWILATTSSQSRSKGMIIYLVWPSWIRSKIWVKVKGTASPYNGDSIYWSQRNAKYSRLKPSVVSMLRRQKFICLICTKEFNDQHKVEVDHIQPVALGGTNSYDNLQAVHDYCHTRKSVSDLKIIRSRLSESQTRPNL